MADYRITAPDGTQYKISGPDNEDPGDVLEMVKQQHEAPITASSLAPAALSALRFGLAAANPAQQPELMTNLATQFGLNTVPQALSAGWNLIHGRTAYNTQSQAAQLPTIPAAGSTGQDLQTLGGTQADLIGRAIRGGLRALGASPETQRNVTGYGQEVAAAAPLAFPAARLAGRALPAAGSAALDFTQGVARRAGNLAERVIPGGEGAPPPMPPRPGASPIASPAAAGPADFGADTASAARAGILNPDMSPGLQNAITAAGPDANARVANLHAKAERIGVQLTPGEATGDPTLRREEQDNANIIPGLRDQKMGNVAAIRNRIQQLREQVAPDSPGSEGQDVAHSAMTEFGKVVTGDKDAETKAWQDFRDISGDALPIDARATAEAIEAKLESAQSGAAPSMAKNAPDAAFTQPQLARLRQVADAQQRVQDATDAGKTPDPADVQLATVRGQDWMAWRKAANRLMGGAPDEKTFAAGVVKNGLDNPIFTQDAQQNPAIMAAGKKAVAASRYIRDRMDADPAYAATVNGTAESTTFLNAANSENGIHAMQESLLGPNAPSPRGVEDLAAHHLDQIARSGGLEPDQTGVLSTTRFGNLLRSRQSVIRAAVGEGAARELEDIRDVARAITPSPATTGENVSQTANRLREAERNRTTGILGSAPIVGKYISKGASALAENQRIQELRAQLEQENAIATRTMTPYGGITYQDRAVPQGSPLSIARRGDALINQRTPPGRNSPTSTPPPQGPGGGSPPPDTGAPAMPSGGPTPAPEAPPGSTPAQGTGQPVPRLGSDLEALRARFRPPLEGNLSPSVRALEEQAEIARQGMEAARTPQEAAELTRRGVAAQTQAEVANDRLQRGRATRGTRAAEQDSGVDFSGSPPPTPSNRAPIPTAQWPSNLPPMPPSVPRGMPIPGRQNLPPLRPVAPAAAPVAPPIASRSEPMSSEEWHQLVMERMAHGAPESELQDLRRSRDAAVNREAQAKFEAREWDSLRQQPSAPSAPPPPTQPPTASAPMTFEEMMKRRAPAGAGPKGTDLSPFAAVKAASELPKQPPEVYAGQLEAIGGAATSRTTNAMRLAAQALRGGVPASATTTDITAARALLDGMSDEKVGPANARKAVHPPERLRALQEGSLALKREFDKRNQP